MLRILDSLIPNLSAQTANLCLSTPEATVKSFKDIADALELISHNKNFSVPSKSKQLLALSSRVMIQSKQLNS